MADVAILIPVLNRPHRVAFVAESALHATPNCRVMFIGTIGDSAEIDALDDVANEYGTDLVDYDLMPRVRYGDYARKINHGVNITDEEFLLFGADDLLFHPGWFEAAVELMDDETAVVGTQDLANRRVMSGTHATHPLVARWYIEQAGTVDEPGKALHEGYLHEYVDDEFIETAKAREVFAFCHESVVEHLHPAVGKAPVDDLYAQEPRRMVQGRRLFQQRRPLWTRRS